MVYPLNNHMEKLMNLEKIQNALFDMYDIRDTLSTQTKRKPKSEGSDETIGEAIDDVIEFLDALETELTKLVHHLKGETA